MLFTLVEPHRGHEVAYNRWYERDHFYAGCMVGPWLFAGRRFVATRAAEGPALRQPTPTCSAAPPLGLLRGDLLDPRRHHDDHVDWALRQVQWLHANGRMFAERDHIHTLLYRHAFTARADDDGVPAELALDHPFGGRDRHARAPGCRRDGRRAGPLRRPSVRAGAGARLHPHPARPRRAVTQQGHDGLEGCLLNLSFTISARPAPGGTSSGPPPHASRRDGRRRDALDGAVHPDVPGTDTYTDQLW